MKPKFAFYAQQGRQNGLDSDVHLAVCNRIQARLQAASCQLGELQPVKAGCGLSTISPTGTEAACRPESGTTFKH